MKQATGVLSLVWVLAMSACSSQPSSPSLTEQYQQLAQTESFSMLAMRKIADEAYRESNFSLMQDALWTLCQRGVATSGGEQDCARLLDLTIIENDVAGQIKANTALYFVTRERSYYTQAMALAGQSEDVVNLFTVTGVNLCLQTQAKSASLAMQCYLAGKQFRDAAALKKAVTLFEQYDALHNVADSYYLLAQIMFAQGEREAASDYAAKAALLLTQLGEKARAAAVRRWRQDTLYAQ